VSIQGLLQLHTHGGVFRDPGHEQLLELFVEAQGQGHGKKAAED
jgi:hypothetical protein